MNSELWKYTFFTTYSSHYYNTVRRKFTMKVGGVCVCVCGGGGGGWGWGVLRSQLNMYAWISDSKPVPFLLLNPKHTFLALQKVRKMVLVPRTVHRTPPSPWMQRPAPSADSTSVRSYPTDLLGSGATCNRKWRCICWVRISVNSNTTTSSMCWILWTGKWENCFSFSRSLLQSYTVCCSVTLFHELWW